MKAHILAILICFILASTMIGSCNPSGDSIGMSNSTLVDHSFSDGVNPGYDSGQNGSGADVVNITIINQKLRIAPINSNDGYVHGAYFGVNYTEPFMLQTTVQKTSGAQGSLIGLGFGNRTRSNVFLLNRDSTFKFVYNDGAWNNYVDWTFHAFLSTASNTVAIRVNKNVAELYINDVLVSTLENFVPDDFDYIELYTQMDAIVLFDNVKLVGQRIR